MTDTFQEINNQIALLTEDVLQFHHDLAQKYTMEQNGEDNIPLVESAIGAAFATGFGQDLYPTISDKAAALLYGLAKNHGFSDGNKRVALHTMETFLYANGIELLAENSKEVVIRVAKSDARNRDLVHYFIVRWLGKWTEDISNLIFNADGSVVGIISDQDEESMY